MHIIPLHAANPGPFTGDGNWTYLIPGDSPVLVDAGVGNPSHLDALAAAAAAGPAHVLVTHAHSDHAAGVPAIGRRWPRARFSKFPWPGEDREVAAGWNAIDEGATVMTGAGRLDVLHTPGHSPDHITLWHADSRTIFVGDLMQLGSSVFIPASKGGSLADYLHSLRRILALAPARALPAHGPAIEDPAALIAHYLEHRHKREVQVLNALEAGRASVEAITARLYTGVTAEVLPLARESVLAHLQKLAHDGLARRDGESWSVVR
ncbi:MAG: MBL fold metallo-hydrolase [Vicinamibacterales bacterium]